MGLENAIYTLDKIRWFYNMSMDQRNNNTNIKGKSLF
jgi:hypothetical protein